MSLVEEKDSRTGNTRQTPPRNPATGPLPLASNQLLTLLLWCRATLSDKLVLTVGDNSDVEPQHTRALTFILTPLERAGHTPQP